MRHIGQISIIGASLVALIVLAGFFAEASPRSAKEALRCDPPKCPSSPAEVEVMAGTFADGHHQVLKASTPPPVKGLLNLTNAPGYRRAGDLSLRVQDCTKAEDDLESKLQEIRGEILEMLMEGTAGSRTCTLSVVIPADKFRAFITDLRKMGSIQTERITASKLKPGQGEAGATEGNPDPRELSLVSIRMADEKVAQTVLESRGILASSFDRGSSHFMKGMAVLVEAFGLVLPFALAFLGVAAPFVIARQIRRSKSALASQ